MTNQEPKCAVIADLVDRVAQAVQKRDVRAVREVITEALKAKVQHDLVRVPEFQKHIALLATQIEGNGDDYIVLTLAELGRLHTSVRSKSEWIPTLAAKVVSSRRPVSFQYGDGDQRHHAAIAVVASGVPLDPYFVAKTVVEEEKGEKARRVWIRALLNGVPLPQVFQCMASAIAESGGKSGDNRSLRLQRIIDVLNEQFLQSDLQVDESICEGLRDFVTKSFANVPRPREYRPSAETVEALIKAAIQLIRFRFRLGAEPDFYKAVALAERWLPDGGWRLLASRSSGLKQLRRILLEGLLLLLERGTPDVTLVEAHRSLSPDRNIAQKELNELEASARNLSPELRGWLVSGGTKTLTPQVVELDETDDLSIAMAMIVADKLRHAKVTGINAMTDDIRFRVPLHVDTIMGMVDLVEQLVSRINFLAERRRLRLFGSPGEIVDYSPHAHRLPEDEPIARRVRVQSPGVEKQGRLVSRVVVPALVDAST